MSILALDPGRMAYSWRWYETPEEGVEYLFSADPGGGHGGDPSTAQCFTRNTSPVRHVGTGEGQIDVFDFADALFDASRSYAFQGKPAVIAVEDDGLGVATVRRLTERRANQIRRFETERKGSKSLRYGWHTGPAGWDEPFRYLLRSMDEGLVVWRDRRTVIQFRKIKQERNREGDIVLKLEEPDEARKRRDPTRSPSGDLVKSAAIGAQILLTQRSRPVLDKKSAREVEPVDAWSPPWAKKVKAFSTWEYGGSEAWD